MSKLGVALLAAIGIAACGGSESSSGLPWVRDGNVDASKNLVLSRGGDDQGLVLISTSLHKEWRLTREPDSSPGFSPDGQSIVFSWGATLADSRLMIGRLVEERGAPHVVELRELGHGAEPAWSPDGREVAFVDLEGVKILDVATSDATLVSQDVGLEGPVWEREGKSLLVTSVGLPGLFRLDLDTSVLRRLTDERDSEPALGRDGSIVFSRAEINGACAIHELDETGDVHRLTDASNYCDVSPSVADDGKSLAFTRIPSFGQDVIAATSKAELYVQDAVGQPTKLTSNGVWDGDCHWAPVS